MMINACPSSLATGACQVQNCTRNHLITFCKICRLVCQDIRSYTAHLEGRGHTAKLKNSSINLFCTACNRDVVANSWDSHVRTQKHLKISRKAGGASQLQEALPPLGSLHCRFCNRNIKIGGWGPHQSGLTHQKKEQYFLLKAVFDVAINDKGGVVITPPEELDFETIELSHAQQGIVKQLNIQVTDPSVKYKIVQVTIARSENRRNTA